VFRCETDFAVYCIGISMETIYELYVLMYEILDYCCYLELLHSRLCVCLSTQYQMSNIYHKHNLRLHDPVDIFVSVLELERRVKAQFVFLN